jgi:lipopolysaccharide transport system ATP-binding protein
MTIVIDADDLAKRYLISHQRRKSNDTLRDELAHFVRRLGRRAGREESEEFWALKGVSFQVREGDRIGIIGRNGAGKSTLLKILSRITEPTAGRISIRGRVASLLEVGTGFHPELSGRENIYLNGAILGMKRQEIKRKFDEIVAFAEVEKFLDTPVKRYSSGMYVRLAFAVAAHLDPEILIVDEVLAVGDVAFQKKCLAKMNTASEEGRTVLFVSHNIPAIQNLCNRAILLSDGRLHTYGEVGPVVRQYLEQSQQLSEIPLSERRDRGGNGAIRFISFTLHDASGVSVSTVHSGQHVRLLFRFATKSRQELKQVVFAVGVDNEAGERMAYLCNEMAEEAFETVSETVNGIEIEVDKLPLIAGTYRLTLYCSAGGEVADWIQDAGSITVEPGDFYGTGRLPPVASQGYLLIHHRFNLMQL